MFFFLPAHWYPIAVNTLVCIFLYALGFIRQWKGHHRKMPNLTHTQLYPAVNSQLQSRHHNLPCHLISVFHPWLECFSSWAEAEFERNVFHSICLWIWDGGRQKVKNTWVSFRSWKCSGLTPNKGLSNVWWIKLNSEQTTLQLHRSQF